MESCGQSSPCSVAKFSDADAKGSRAFKYAMPRGANLDARRAAKKSDEIEERSDDGAERGARARPGAKRRDRRGATMARSAERVPAQERSDEIGAERRWRGARSACPPRSEATR